MSERLLVLLHGEAVGHLERADSDDPSFSYDPEYVRSAEVALSARLPLRTQTFPPAKVRPYLWGLLPENSQVRETWAQQWETSPDDAFGRWPASRRSSPWPGTTAPGTRPTGLLRPLTS